MRHLLTTALLFASATISAHCAELQRMGDTVDYVLSALGERGSGQTTGDVRSAKSRLLHGGYITAITAADWASAVSTVKSSVKAALEQDEGVQTSVWSASPSTVPALLIVSGLKQKEQVCLHIWLFPSQDGKVALTYTQENFAP